MLTHIRNNAKFLKLIFFILPISVWAETFENIFLDNMRNVHVMTQAGKDIQLIDTNNAINPKLSPDGKTAAWLINFSQNAEENLANELVIYRKGKKRSVQCEPLIRDYWFWKKGSYIAIDCGGTHFAGKEILYNANTLKKISEFNQLEVPMEKRPAWSNLSD